MHSISEAAISVAHVTQQFASVRALDDLNFAVPAGTIYGFVGPNGAGKTTTIKAVLGLLFPQSGAIQVYGHNPQAEGPLVRTLCGVLLEQTGLYERLSAMDNLDFYGRVWRLDPDERRRRAEALLKTFGLWDRRQDRAGLFSKGMKQKLAIARVLIHRPKLILLDEPTSGLDPEASATLRQDLRDLAEEEGVTIFLTTHNLPEVEQLCTSVGVIRAGRIIAQGSPAELRAHTGKHQVLIAGSGFSDQLLAQVQHLPGVTGVAVQGDELTIKLATDQSVAPIVAALVQGGAAVENVQKGTASLEEAFLSLMGSEEAHVA